ncbi:MAG: hypothetical protein KGJ53_04250 [Alphaproteobacteria bacterium]|nr:hypothetical protein [Alphaproteobacteria bacterium]
MFRKILILAVAFTLAGCATAPTKTQFSNSRSYPGSYDAVWTQVVHFFATNNIPIKNIAKDSGVIYAEASSFDSNDADCGSNPLMTPQQNVIALNVFVQDKGDHREVSVNATFRQVLVGPYNTVQTVTCLSRGTIEQTIFDSIH